MSPISAGEAYVSIYPDLRKFGESLKRQMAQQSAVIKRQTDELGASMSKSFDGVTRSVDDAGKEMGEFGDSATKAGRQTQTSFSGVDRSIGAVSNEMSKLAEIQRGATSASIGQRRAALDLGDAQSRLATIQASSSSTARDVERAQLNVEQAHVRVRESTVRSARANDDYDRSVAGLVPDVNNARSSLLGFASSLGGSTHGMSMLGGTLSFIKWPALIHGANLAAAAISSLSAAAVGAVSSLAPLGGLVAAIPSLMGAAGAAVGTASLGFFGVGDALTAMNNAATATGGAVGGAAGATEDAGRRVSEAARGVTDAQRGVVAANRTVQDSQRSLQDSHRSLQDSERSLADAHRQVEYAQESLTDAREDARQTLEDLHDEVARGSLTEEQAKLRILQARQALRETYKDDNATRLDVRQAILDIKQAEFDLGQVREDNRENQKALNEAEREGISGSEQVVSARRSRADAERGVADAERGVADAERGVADAERALAESHRGVADAQRAVADAQRAVTEAQQSGTPVAAAASAETTALAEAMAALSPAGRDFAQVLFDLKPRLDELRATAQQGLLPGVGRAIQELTNELFPLLNRVVGETARTMGQLAERAGEVFTSERWQGTFRVLSDAITPLLRSSAGAVFNLVEAFRVLAEAGQPLALWLGRLVVKGTELFKTFLQGAEESGSLAEFLERTRGTVERLLSIFGNLGQVLGDVLMAGQDLGRWLLRQFDDLTEGWADWTGSIEGQNALKQWFEDAKPVIIALGRLIGDVVKGFAGMSTTRGLPQLINQLRTELLPVFLDIFRTASGKLIPSLITLATNFLRVFRVFGTETGVLLGFVRALSAITGAITNLVAGQPQLASMLVTFGAFRGALLAVKFAGFLTGASKALNLVAGVGTSAAVAAPKVTLLSRALTALGVPTAAGAAGTGGPIVAAMAVGAATFRGLDILTDKLHRMGGAAADLGAAMRNALNVLTAGAFSGFNQILDKGMEFLGLKEDVLGVASAEDQLAAAQENAKFKQEALTAARENARLALQDLRDTAERGAISEARAEIALATARDNLTRLERSGTASSRELRSARLDVRSAELDLADAREEQKKNQKDLTKAEKDGIEGTKAVVDARRAKVAADVKSIRSERRLADTQKDSGKATLSLWGRIKEAAKTLNDVLQKAWDDIRGAIAKAARRAWQVVREAWDSMREKVGDASEAIGRKVREGLGVVGRVFRRVWLGVLDIVGFVAAKVVSAVGAMASFVIDKFADVINAANTVVQKIPGLPKALKDASQSGADSINDFRDSVKDSFDRTAQNLNQLGEDTREKLGKVGKAHKDAGESIKKTTREYGREVLTKHDEMLRGLGEGANAVRESFGIERVPIPTRSQGHPTGMAAGGRVPGSGDKDTVPAMLTPGEYVIRKQAVQAIGVRNLERLNRGVGNLQDTLRDGMQVFAKGGVVNNAKASLLELLYPANDAKHQDHLHYAMSSPAAAQMLARAIEKVRGGTFYVGELENYGGTGQISSGHSSGSYHYSGQAGDVNAAAGESPYEKGQLNWLAGWITRAVGSGLFAANPKKIVNEALKNVAVPIYKGLLKGLGESEFKEARQSLIELAKEWVSKMSVEGAEPISGKFGSIEAMLKAAAAQAPYNWTGAQWNALRTLISNESGFNPTAQNPDSSAYGLFQFLDSTWAGVGGTKTSDPRLQIAYGLKYIAQNGNFSNPIEALAFWNAQSPHWYGKGGKVDLADQGGVFKGPGMVGIGDITETVFQPARKVSNLPRSKSGRLEGSLTITNWQTGEAYFQGIVLDEMREEARYQEGRSRTYQ